MNRWSVVTGFNACGMETFLKHIQSYVAGFGVLGAPGKGHDTANIGWHGSAVEPGVSHVVTQTTGGGFYFVQLHKADTVLGNKYTVFGQQALTASVELGGEEYFARTDRIGTVGDDDIKAAVSIGSAIVNELNTVNDDQIQARILIGTRRVFGQPLFAHLNNSTVDLHHRDLLHGLVLEHFPQHATVATPDNQHTLGVTVGKQGDVGQHFMINELVTLGRLDGAIQSHRATKFLVFEDNQMLMFRTCFKQYLVNSKVLTVGAIQGFRVEIIFEHDAFPPTQESASHRLDIAKIKC